MKYLILIALFIISCSIYNEEEECYYMPSDCVKSAVIEGTVDIELTYNNLNPIVPVIVYRGMVETGKELFRLDCSPKSHSFTLMGNEYYSIKAQYQYKRGDSLITVYSVDGGSLESKSKSYCEGSCYSPGTLELKAILDSILFEK